ncbi:MAG: alanine racemase [Desulfovibrionaceae bacterium]
MNPFSTSPCTAVVNLSAIRRNYEKCAALGHMMPVIKSDAYGHGMLAVADALDAAGARDFAVGTVSEAAALRGAGFTQFITCLLGAQGMDDMARACALGVTPLITSFDSLALAALQGTPERPFAVGIKCNTGMTRLGFGPEEIPSLLDHLRALPNLRPVLALSHLACADMPEQEDYTREQIATFEVMSRALRTAFPGMRRSLANSAATLAMPECRYELCRPGLVLYGGNPFHGTDRAGLGDGLQWAMSVKTPILQVRGIRQGVSVSYGRLFTSQRPTRVAVLAVGYADGFPRDASGKVRILINGQLVPQIGRVCMGMIMADVSSLPAVRAGDEAWILGGPAGGPQGMSPQGMSPQDWADLRGTIPYEIMCLLGRNTREYV